jgi:hypothetical protein
VRREIPKPKGPMLVLHVQQVFEPIIAVFDGPPLMWYVSIFDQWPSLPGQ